MSRSRMKDTMSTCWMLLALFASCATGAVAAGVDLGDLLRSGDRRTLRVQAEELITKNNDFRGALPLLERWIEAAPSDADGAYLLARCYTNLGRYGDAVLAARLAVENGLANAGILMSSTEFEPLRSRKDYHTLVDAMRSREQADRQFPVMFARQVRWGRYRVGYPAHYVQGRRYKLVLLLHGNGHTPEFMLSWARGLGLDDCIFVCPEAPYLKIRESFGSLRERYSAAGEGLGMADSSQSDIVTTSAQWYHDVAMDAREKLPVTMDKTIIVGFSQGGFYSQVLATRYPAYYRSVVSICASMYAAGRVVERLDSLRTYGIDVLILHGRSDDIVPFQTGELLAGAMTRAGVRHDFVPFDGGHWPSHDASIRIRQWITNHP